MHKSPASLLKIQFSLCNAKLILTLIWCFYNTTSLYEGVGHVILCFQVLCVTGYKTYRLFFFSGNTYDTCYETFSAMWGLLAMTGMKYQNNIKLHILMNKEIHEIILLKIKYNVRYFLKRGRGREIIYISQPISRYIDI